MNGKLLCQLLGLWCFLVCAQAVPVGKVQSDAKILTKTVITRLNDISHTSVSARVSGLNFIPEHPISTLSQMKHALAVYQKLLTSLAPEGVAQISNDLENLQELLQLLASFQGCSVTNVNDLKNLENLDGLMKTSLHSTEVVVLSKLQGSLQEILKQLDHNPGC